MNEAEPDVRQAALSLIERLNERLNDKNKRRTEIVGIFPNETSIKRLVGAILLEQNDEWAVQRSLHDAGNHRAHQR